MRFWTSDLHFGHANIIEYSYRPFHTVGHMNETLIANWNAVVSPDDEVMILGDIAMGKIADTLPLVERLNGEKFHIAGNHDRWFGLLSHAGEDTKKGRDWKRWSLAYQEVGLYLLTDEWQDMWVGGHLVRVCHFPYAGDHTDEDRYVENRPPNDGHVLLHGHIHEKWKVNGRQINVGVDHWDYYPAPEPEIVKLIEEVRYADASEQHR